MFERALFERALFERVPDNDVMKDAEVRALLQRALPRLGLRWVGFRNVSGQVCKRIGRRIAALGLADVSAYEARLQADAAEWRVLERLCAITISRFHRDAPMWQRLRADVLPTLADAALAAGESKLCCWSVGCASGEEPYTLSILWALELAQRYPALRLRILATDAGEEVLARARSARYAAASLSELPATWREGAFAPVAGLLQLREPFRAPVELRRADVRRDLPEDTFRLILCRNVVCTYFDEQLQRETLQRLLSRLAPGGALVIGLQERLPADTELGAGHAEVGIYRRASA